MARRSWPGTSAVTTRSGVASSAATASPTVAKLSSRYCAHSASDTAGRSPVLAGYCDSASHSRLVTRPASLTPSVVEMS